MPDDDRPRHVSDAEWQRLKREAREHARRSGAAPPSDGSDAGDTGGPAR